MERKISKNISHYINLNIRIWKICHKILIQWKRWLLNSYSVRTVFLLCLPPPFILIEWRRPSAFPQTYYDANISTINRSLNPFIAIHCIMQELLVQTNGIKFSLFPAEMQETFILSFFLSFATISIYFFVCFETASSNRAQTELQFRTRYFV